MMAKIMFEGYIDGPHSRVTERFIIEADTSEALHALATAKANRRGMSEHMSVGIHNNRADWEAIYGPSKPDCAFADDPPPPSSIIDFRRCKACRYTIGFAGLALAAFAAIQLVRSILGYSVPWP